MIMSQWMIQNKKIMCSRKIFTTLLSMLELVTSNRCNNKDYDACNLMGVGKWNCEVDPILKIQ